MLTWTRFHSFLKVGGGFTVGDYARIRYSPSIKPYLIISHITEGCWIDWDPNNPPNEYVELAGTAERPDQWIKPDKFLPVDSKLTTRSVVLQVKAAEVVKSGYSFQNQGC